jgi:hypothetical protein
MTRASAIPKPTIRRKAPPVSVLTAEVSNCRNPAAPPAGSTPAPSTAAVSALAVSTAAPATVSDSAPARNPNTMRGAISRRL